MSKWIIYATTLKTGREHLQIVKQQKALHWAEHVATRLKFVSA